MAFISGGEKKKPSEASKISSEFTHTHTKIPLFSFRQIKPKTVKKMYPLLILLNPFGVKKKNCQQQTLWADCQPHSPPWCPMGIHPKGASRAGGGPGVSGHGRHSGYSRLSALPAAPPSRGEVPAGKRGWDRSPAPCPSGGCWPTI